MLQAMKRSASHYLRRLDHGVDHVRRRARPLLETTGMTGFAYVRVYNDGRLSWVTSDADHDRLLIERNFLEDDPLLHDAGHLGEGNYLWFHDREFPDCESFYRDRESLFNIDHGMVMIRHHDDYLESACFSGCLSKRPMYNTFMNEAGLLGAFVDHFRETMGSPLEKILSDGIPLCEVKGATAAAKRAALENGVRHRLVDACGWTELLSVSKRERECLRRLLEGKTYRETALELGISDRTVEHHLESVRDRLAIVTRSELLDVARTLAALRLL